MLGKCCLHFQPEGHAWESRTCLWTREAAPALQAKAGGFSAYAYELLPLMHTLMGHNKVETDLLSTDMLAFLSGFKGHITPVMQDFAANAKRGAMGREAASQKEPCQQPGQGMLHR